MFRSTNSWSGLVILCASVAFGVGAGCGDDENTATTNTGPTGAGTTTTGGSGGTGQGGNGGTGAQGGTGGMGGDGGTGGGGGMAPDFTPLGPNRLTNGDIEAFTAPGAQPPFDPPDSFATFGAQLTPAFAAVGFDQYATQAHDAPIFKPSDPGDQSNLFPGYMNSRALKIFGRSVGAGGDLLEHTLGTIYQELSAGTLPPAGSKLRITGWAYHSSVDPLEANNNVYLVIKCFNADFSAELCGGGLGAKSIPVTMATTADTWVQYGVDVDVLDANAAFVQAGVEFEQCAGAQCNTGAGSVFWDELYFSYQ